MLHSLDIVIGLAAVYTAFSLLASWVQEGIATAFQLRSATLKSGIGQMVNDATTHAALFGQPSITAAQSPKERDPSYISANQFSMAVMGIINGASAAGTTGAAALAQLQSGIDGLRQSRLKDALKTLSGEANGDLTKFVSGIETWFDDQMDRVSGWYRRYAQIILLFVGAAIAALFNVDTLRIGQSFTSTPLTINTSKLSGNVTTAQQYVSSDVFAHVALGWPDANACPPSSPDGSNGDPSCATPDMPLKIFWKIVGLLMTAVALSLGAPFWFDTLARLVNVRGAGPPPAQSTKGGTS